VDNVSHLAKFYAGDVSGIWLPVFHIHNELEQLPPRFHLMDFSIAIDFRDFRQGTGGDQAGCLKESGREVVQSGGSMRSLGNL